MSAKPSKDYVSPEKCDMDDPQEHFLWALMQIPVGPHEMMPILENTARTMSKHLWETGFRHHPQLQRKKYQRPLRGQQNHMNGLARWVDMDSEDPEPLMLPDIGSMTTEERDWMVAELKRHGAIHEPKPQLVSKAEVADWNPVEMRPIKRTTSTEEQGI
jgi:hypothetical protein